jgi:hypothetical protein
MSSGRWSLVAPYLLLRSEDAGQRERDLRAVLQLAARRPAEPTATIIDGRTLRSLPESGARASDDGASAKRARRSTWPSIRWVT